jgi:FAD:protein FMN transferase
MKFEVWGLTGSLTTERADQLDAATASLTAWLSSVDDAANRFRPDSEISRINSSHGREVEISPTFARLLDGALESARVSDNLCDPTVLASLEALGYRDDFDVVRERVDIVAAPPTPAPGPGAIHFDAATRRLQLDDGCRLDFGASAKALCADLIADEIAPTGGVVVEIGGDVAVRSRSRGGPWVIGVSDELTIYGNEPRIAFTHGGVATSSIKHRTWTSSHRPVHHIIDPRTGTSAQSPFVTVTVAASSCLIANAFATAALIWGEEAGFHIAQAGWSGRLVRTDGTVEFVGGWPREEEQS